MHDLSDRSIRPEKQFPPPLGPQRQSTRGLDWFVFFVADVQTGFGPFIAVYLTANKWTQVDIGLVMTVGGLISLLGQIPAGALLDRINSPRRTAAISTAMIGVSALILALWPNHPGVFASRIIQAGASAVLGPAIAAISLGLSQSKTIGLRFGRNAAFASVGTGLAAAAMGLAGYYISNQSVFFVTASLALPALVALFYIKASDIDPRRAHGGERQKLTNLSAALHFAADHKGIFILAFCVFLFHFANASVLLLIAGNFTLRSSSTATPLIAVAMIVPQLIVAVLSPLVGKATQDFGRRIFLMAAFGTLFLRILSTAFTTNQFGIVAIQALDGISGAIIGVLVPLTVADLTRNTGRFNLSQGFVGCAMGIGASFSTSAAGYVADRFNTFTALTSLSLIAALGFVMVLIAMPETREA